MESNPKCSSVAFSTVICRELRGNHQTTEGCQHRDVPGSDGRSAADSRSCRGGLSDQRAQCRGGLCAGHDKGQPTHSRPAHATTTARCRKRQGQSAADTKVTQGRNAKQLAPTAWAVRLHDQRLSMPEPNTPAAAIQRSSERRSVKRKLELEILN